MAKRGSGPAVPSTASLTGAFVGRGHELGVIGSLLEQVVAGRFGALMIGGDAGVGKTRLVEHACATVAERHHAVVFSGACLPLATMAVPLLPIRAAVRRRPTGFDPPDLDDGAERGQSGGLPVVFDEWLERVCRSQPVILVIDDLQWADESTLDLLLYVLAGSPDRRLGVVTTVRSGELTPGHPLRGWLADVRRLPSFGELVLGPLDRNDTRAQLGGLLGGPPHESLVQDVWERSGGNAYLTRLLVSGSAPDARHLGSDLPGDLREAVLRAWHRLPEAVRELVRLIAVGGEVAHQASLRRAADLAGLSHDDAVRLLRSAVEAGVLDVDERGGYWFHHPLQAEALESTLAPAERRSLHAAFARACEADLGNRADDGEPEAGGAAVVELTAVADHHHRAGRPGDAYRWALRAAAASAASGGSREQLRLIQRAVDLRPAVIDAPESRRELLERLRSAASQLAEHEVELSSVEALLADLHGAEGVDGVDGLAVAELLVRRGHLRFSTGRAFLATDDVRRAVDLSAHDPLSWQHALALAELCHAGLWHGEPGVDALADQALRNARAAGHPRALAYALAANAMLAVFEERMADGSAFAREAVEAAVEAGDGWAFVHASLWEANALDAPVNPENGRLLQRRRQQLQELGGAHAYVAWLSACEAMSRYYVGDVDQCRSRLRVALGSDPGVSADVLTRLVAALLAARQGRQGEAEAHLARAEELFAETSTFVAFQFDAVRATVRLEAGDTVGAFEAAMAGATVTGAPPTMCEWLMPLAARALADQAQAARDSGRRVDEVLATLSTMVDRFPHVIADTGGTTPFYARELEALDALYAAEVARARRDPDEPRLWERAAERLSGVLPWEETYAAWRAAEAMLARAPGQRDPGQRDSGQRDPGQRDPGQRDPGQRDPGPGQRERAAALLRHADDLGRELGALPVLREVESLARTARIPLGRPESSPVVPHGVPVLDGLTPREHEVLTHILAGRTYSEIARALYVSEKTVSTHVSNLLRKTGAANRIDLARMAGHQRPDP